MSTVNAPVGKSELLSRTVTETLAYGTVNSTLAHLEVRYRLCDPAQPEYAVTQQRSQEPKPFSQLITSDLDHAIAFYNSLIQPEAPAP